MTHGRRHHDHHHAGGAERPADPDSGAENLPLEVVGEPATPVPPPAAESDAARREAALQDRLLRLQAEFDNFRKRQQRDRDEANRQARERILGELPGIVDNLERAVRHAGPDASTELVLQGVELVLRQFQELLGRFGVAPIAALGAPFDPNLHEAMARVDTNGDPPDGTVVEEYRRGYLLDGRVLRPALVAVAKLAGAEEGEPGA